MDRRKMLSLAMTGHIPLEPRMLRRPARPRDQRVARLEAAGFAYAFLTAGGRPMYRRTAVTALPRERAMLTMLNGRIAHMWGTVEKHEFAALPENGGEPVMSTSQYVRMRGTVFQYMDEED